MAEPTEADWTAARELCRALSQEFDPAEHRSDAKECNWCRACAAALAESREEGRREERRDIVALMNDRRLGGLTIYGLREEIAARGPME